MQFDRDNWEALQSLLGAGEIQRLYDRGAIDAIERHREAIQRQYRGITRGNREGNCEARERQSRGNRKASERQVSGQYRGNREATQYANERISSTVHLPHSLVCSRAATRMEPLLYVKRANRAGSPTLQNPSRVSAAARARSQALRVR
jgi:hypothetical protein